MSIQIKTQRNLEGPFPYVVYPELRCAICLRKIDTMNPGMVMGAAMMSNPAYYVHKGSCMDKLLDGATELDVPTEVDWVVDEVHDHFFRLLWNMGFIIEDGQIILEQPK